MIVKKKQVTKRIVEPGQNLGKPGKPFVVKVAIRGYFAAQADDLAAEADQ